MNDADVEAPVEIEMISVYRGKRVEEMTREELIEAVKYLGKQLMDAHQRTIDILEMHKQMRLAEAKRKLFG